MRGRVRVNPRTTRQMTMIKFGLVCLVNFVDGVESSLSS